MLKIQYGIAGFFTGAFTGLLLSLIERRFIDVNKYPNLLFLAAVLTIIVCAIVGVAQALSMANRRLKNKK